MALGNAGVFGPAKNISAVLDRLPFSLVHTLMFSLEGIIITLVIP